MQANKKEQAPRGPGHGPMGAMHVQKPKNFKKSIGRLTKALKPFYGAILVALLFAVFSTVFNIVGPRLVGEMTNHIQNSINPAMMPLQANIDWQWFNMMGFILVGLYFVSYFENK